MQAIAVDLDAVLADTHPLWRDWLEDAARRARVELDVPEDRTAAAAILDERLGDWRPLLRRFADDRGAGPFPAARRDERTAAAVAGRRDADRRLHGRAASSSRTSRSRTSARRGG